MTGNDVLPWFGPINDLREHGADIGRALPHIEASERNKAMVWSFLAGRRASDIARDEGLSSTRVGSIIRLTARNALVWRSSFGDRPGDAEGYAQATTLHGKLKHVSLTYLPLSIRGKNSLQHHGFKTVGDIWLLTARDLHMRNCGKKTVADLIACRAEAAGVVDQCTTLDEFRTLWRDPAAVKQIGPIRPVDPKPMEILGHCPAGIAHGTVIPHEGKFFCECRCGWRGPVRKTRDGAILAWRSRH